MSDCIVYAAFDTAGNCLYIGEGKPDRYEHIDSGVSHVYEANKWHFSGRRMDIKILHEGLTKEEAISREQMEILERKPAWNKCEYASTQLKDMYSFVTSRVIEFVKVNSRYRTKQKHYINMAKDLCKLMNKGGVTSILQGQNWSRVKLPVGFMSHLAKDDDKYYPVLRYIFDVVKNEGRSYTVTLKGWDNEE